MKTYLCYARSGREFEVTDKLAEMGIDAYCAKQMKFVRKGKQRRAEAEILPYLQNYLFAEIPDDRYLDALSIKYLASTMHPLTRADIRHVERFRHAVDAEYAEQDRRRRNQEAVSEYKPGQALQFLDGRFSDSMLTFRSIVERPHDMHPKIRASVKMMGREVVMEVDPLSVRAAE